MIPVGFIFLSGDSPLLALLPAGYENNGVFQDFQEAIAYYSKNKQRDASGQKVSELILVINGLNYYRNVSLLQREPEALLLQSLIKLRTAAGGAGIKLLMPEEKSTAQNLLIDLMSQGFYDFWFLAGLDSRLFQEILITTRSFRQLEAYLGTLPLPVIPEPEEGRRLWQVRLQKGSRLLQVWLSNKIGFTKGGKRSLWRKPASPAEVKAMAAAPASEVTPALAATSVPPSAAASPPALVAAAVPPSEATPEPTAKALTEETLLEAPAPRQWLPLPKIKLHIKMKKQKTTEMPRAGSTALFFSEEDCLLTYALAFLTAAHLAGGGGKTLLVELPGSGSRLGKALGLYLPEKSLSAALQDFAAGARGPWQPYCIRGAGPDYALLDILPQGQIEKKLYPFWDSFLASFVHWAIMEEQYTYILYLGFGEQASLCWKDSLVCRSKIIVLSPWSPSFNEAPYLQGQWKSRCLPVFDGSWGAEQVKKQIKDLALEQYFIIPPAVKKDFIALTALEGRRRDVSAETRQCLAALWQSI